MRLEGFAGSASGYERRNKRWRISVLRLSNGLDDLAVEHSRQAQEHFRGARRTLPRAITNAIAVLAKIRGCQRNVLKHLGGHRFT